MHQSENKHRGRPIMTDLHGPPRSRGSGKETSTSDKPSRSDQIVCMALKGSPQNSWHTQYLDRYREDFVTYLLGTKGIYPDAAANN